MLSVLNFDLFPASAIWWEWLWHVTVTVSHSSKSALWAPGGRAGVWQQGNAVWRSVSLKWLNAFQFLSSSASEGYTREHSPTLSQGTSAQEAQPYPTSTTHQGRSGPHPLHPALQISFPLTSLYLTSSNFSMKFPRVNATSSS